LSAINSGRFQILDRYMDVAPFVQAASDASDANRDLLGFLPKGLFDEFARRNDLFVLVVPDGGSSKYAGHLLFERRFPRPKVLQIFIAVDCRGRKFARRLSDHLVSLLTREGFTSIYARVGEDMSEANECWGSLGFRVQRTEPGGITTGRTIVVRVRELDSPQLFPTRSIDQADPLGLSQTPTTEVPIFLIDLNVLFDLSPQRKRHDDAVALFKAERANFCKLAISDEVLSELARTAAPGRPDPMMNLARTFSTFPVSKSGPEDVLFKGLCQLVFPTKALQALTPNDVSDLRHLITAVENHLAGLITSDQASLDAAPVIEAKFGIQVVSPKSFVPTESAGRIAVAFATATTNLTLTPMVQADEADVRSLLARLGVSGAAVASGWLSPLSDRQVSTSCVIRNGPELLAYMTWPAIKHDGTTTIRAAVDESKLLSLEAARGALIHCMNLNVDGPTTLRLITPRDQVLIHDIARAIGFCSVGGAADLRKIALGRVATKATWDRCRAELAEISGLKMNGPLPIYRGINQQIPYITQNGDLGYEPLERIETLLSPTLFCLPDRPAVITPIRHEFSALLLGHSKQNSLLPAPASNLFQERHFLSGPNTFHHLKRGTLIIFYESNDRRGPGELVAVARVRRSYLKDSAALEATDLAQSVLTTETLPEIGRAAMKTVTVFDNLFPLPCPVSLSRLQALGCGRPIDLITTRPISDTQLQSILAEAFIL
jgi:hypothetical protein